MKILLLMPCSRKIYRSLPLGLLYIAASLREAGFRQVKIIDAREENLDYKEISMRIKEFSPDVVGITGLNIQADDIHKLSDIVKKLDINCKVVIGGAYATSRPEFIIKDPNIDFVVIGEGERAVCNLARALENNENLSRIDGLAFKNHGRLIINPPQTMIKDLDSIPFPAWDLVEMERYFNGPYRRSENPIPISNRVIPLFTSRGCPYQCSYCHNIFGKGIRWRSVQNVIAEIEFLDREYDVKEIEIIDDCFNLDMNRAKQICDEIIKRNIKIRLSFPNGLRVDRMDEELIVKLRKAGTYLIYYAIESASSEVQKRIRKNLDLKKARQIIDYTLRQGIITGGSFMLGFPGETKEEMLQTIRFAKETKFHLANFYYVIPYPETSLFKNLENNNINLDKIEFHSFLKISFNASLISDAELRSVLNRAYREFYMRPSQMVRIWKAIPNKRIILNNLPLVLKRAVIK